MLAHDVLDVDTRKMILERFEAREMRQAKTKERFKKLENCKGDRCDFVWLLEKETVDLRCKKMFLHLLSQNEDWHTYLYEHGYLCSPYIPKKYLAQTDTRLTALRDRYHVWKRLRPYVKTKGLTEDERMYPTYKRCIFQIASKDEKVRKHICDLFVQMLCNYLPFYNVYLYDPIYGGNHAYRYYSGEPVIVYYITEGMERNTHLLRRKKKALFQEVANGYDISNVWRIVLCTYDWQALEGTTGEYKLFTIVPELGDLCQQWMMYWKDYTGTDQFFKAFDLLPYIIQERILPWPYFKKNGKLELLPATRDE